MYNYIHIPFCRRKCLYCKFALTPKWEQFQIEKYVKALKKEVWEFYGTCHAELVSASHQIPQETLKQVQGDNLIQSIYFGGGTPSILTPVQISEIIACFWKNTPSPNLEITLEANPEDITEDFVKWVREVWVNRLSLGIQTLDIESLRLIGRAEKNHTGRALDILESVWFKNVSVDFILGLPGVASGAIQQDIAKLLEQYSCIKHVSVYMLESGTYPASWKGISLSHEAYEEDFLAIREYLCSSWFTHYELSNFARAGFESRHNTSYWNHENYRGFGLSAASYIDGQRFNNSMSFGGYYAGEIIDSEVLTDEQKRLEEIMFRFRTFRGIQKELFPEQERLSDLTREWYLREEEGCIFLNSTWIFLLDYIMGELI